MVVVSLESGELPDTCLEADICIVGAGAAGLYLARRLGEFGKTVIVLEAGPAIAVSTEDAGFLPEFTGDLYQGATEGRSFGLGGTTTRWGGQLVHYQEVDGVRVSAAHRNAWTHVVGVVQRRKSAVLASLGIREDDEVIVEEESIRRGVEKASLTASTSRWLPFSQRNFVWMVRKVRGHAESVTVICNATSATWHPESSESGLFRIGRVGAVSPSGRRLQIKASEFVIAAGAIESPRILHEINSGAVPLLPREAAVGMYLTDHLSFKAGVIDPNERARTAELFGPMFRRGQLRTWRFVEARPDPSSPRYFAHFLFNLNSPAFQTARSVLRDLQARRRPTVGLGELWKGCAGLTGLAWSRGLRSRLFIPKGTGVEVQIDMEQRPDASNRIGLGSALDRNGRRVARIQWQVSEQDRLDVQATAQKFLLSWALGVPRLPGVLACDLLDIAGKVHGAYHPVGGCRLGTDGEAVVDLNLRVHGSRNLHVLSTAIFPSAGTANPTFSLLCMSEMLAEELKRKVAA